MDGDVDVNVRLWYNAGMIIIKFIALWFFASLLVCSMLAWGARRRD